MKRCGHCGADFDDRVDFCFNDGTPLELVVVTTVPGAPPKRTQSSRFSNALAGIDAPEPKSLAFDAPDTNTDGPPTESGVFSSHGLDEQPETTDSLDVPDLANDAPVFGFKKTPVEEMVETTDVTDVDLVNHDLETEELFSEFEPDDLTGDDLGDDFGFMQDTGEIEADEIFPEETPVNRPQGSKLPLIMGAAAIVLAIGASVSMLSGTSETEEELRLVEPVATQVEENIQLTPIAGEIEVVNDLGEGSDTEAPALVDLEEILEEDMNQEELDLEEMATENEGDSLGSSGSGRDPAIQPAEVVENDSATQSMPITLNRPAEPPVNTTPERQETPDVPTNTPDAAVVASPWGSVPESNGTNVVASNSRMRVQSTPSGAQVFVDGSVQGTTPADFSITRGNHLIAIEKDGFVRYTENVTVQHDSQMIRATLEPVPQSEFQVVVSFYGASGWRVFESNVPLCTIPCSQQLSTGVHEFRVVNDSDSWVVTREITGDYAGASVGVNLQRD